MASEGAGTSFGVATAFAVAPVSKAPGIAVGISRAQGSITSKTTWQDTHSELTELRADLSFLHAIVLEVEETLTPKTQGEEYNSNRDDL